MHQTTPFSFFSVQQYPEKNSHSPTSKNALRATHVKAIAEDAPEHIIKSFLVEAFFSLRLQIENLNGGPRSNIASFPQAAYIRCEGEVYRTWVHHDEIKNMSTLEVQKNLPYILGDPSDKLIIKFTDEGNAYLYVNGTADGIAFEKAMKPWIPVLQCEVERPSRVIMSNIEEKPKENLSVEQYFSYMLAKLDTLLSCK